MKTGSEMVSWRRPGTRLGWWAAGSEMVFVCLWFLNLLVFYPIGVTGGLSELRPVFFPIFSILMMGCGVAGVVLGIIALIRSERSWMVWLAILPGLFALVFLLGEFFFPH